MKTNIKKAIWVAAFGLSTLPLFAAGSLGADNTYNFGGGNTMRIQNSYDPTTGTSVHGTVNTWGNGNVTSSGSSYGASGDYKSASDNTYNFGGGNTMRVQNSYDSTTGTSVHGTVNTWGNGNVTSSGSSCDASGDYRSTTDNAYNFGGGNTMRVQNNYDPTTGTSEHDTDNTWGNGNSTKTVSGHDANGNNYRVNVNTTKWGNGNTTTTISGQDSEGKYIYKTIYR
jgi:hypothetical protein